MKKWICGICVLLFVLAGCESREVQAEEWGSFTPDTAFSYDEKFYAVQTVKETEHAEQIIVSVYLTASDELVYSFNPARARDFWGNCWESDSYNIWIQSGDIGVYCYKYTEDEWHVDESAVRPDDIISKYDKYSK